MAFQNKSVVCVSDLNQAGDKYDHIKVGTEYTVINEHDIYYQLEKDDENTARYYLKECFKQKT